MHDLKKTPTHPQRTFRKFCASGGNLSGWTNWHGEIMSGGILSWLHIDGRNIYGCVIYSVKN